jgi:hypothetical protein
MIKTMIARYPGRDARTGAAIRPGDEIQFDTATRRAWITADVDRITLHGEHGPTHFTRNKAGLCEDAPCCGCCTI